MRGVARAGQTAGADASAEPATHLTHANAAVRHYAIHGLAVVGDDRAWSRAMSLLIRTLDRPTREYGSLPMSSAHSLFEAMVIITYLVRHLNDGTGVRSEP